MTIVLFPFSGLRRILSAVLVIAPGSALAFELNVRIVDANNQPVSNAVVEVPLTPALPDSSTAMIDQVDRRFVPMVIAVHQGQYVNFPNNDNIRHHVYSFSDAKNFSTELYANEPIAPIQFDKSGIAVLGCNIHDSMVGYIYVSSWQDVAVTDEKGTVGFPALASKPDSLLIWHPWASSAGPVTVDTSTLSDGEAQTITLNIEAPEQNFGFRALRN